MKSTAKQRRNLRGRRHGRIKKRVRGTAGRPRLVVFRSLRHLEGQIVDDDRGVTILGLSSMKVDGGAGEDMSGKIAEAYAAGKALAEKATEKGVTDVVFDRAGYPYHGRIKAFAEGAREGGLRF